MTLQWADFPSGEVGLYGSQAERMLDGTPWLSVNTTPTSNSIANDPDPAIGSAGRVLRHGNGSAGAVNSTRLALTDPDNIVGVCHNFYVAGFSSGVQSFLSFATTGNTIRYEIRVRPNGGLEITRTGSQTVVATADFPVIRANSWNLLETLVNVATGDIEIRRNGITVLTYTDSTPFGGTIGIVGFPNGNPGGGGSTCFSKNIVVYNGQGSEVNSFQGNVIVTDLRPISDVTLGGWTTSSGTEGWSLLDESPPNDADYIEADDTPPAPAEMEFSNLPADVTSVRGLLSIVRSFKTDGGDGNLQISLSPNGVDYDLGADNPVTTAATYRFDVSQISPVTAVPWSPAEVNSIRQRYDRTV
jgi:hypothetical protein